MKGKKLLLSAAVTVFAGLSAAGLAACSEKHEHTYDTQNWTPSETQHWHASNCGCDDAPLEKFDHDWGETVTIAPTCTDEGVTKRVCIVCNYENVISTVPASGHTYGDWTIAENAKPKADAKGSAVRSCTAEDCGAAEIKELPPLTDENYTISEVTANCTEDGTAKYSYVLEGKTVSFTADMKKTGHSLNPVYTHETNGHRQACTNTGCTYKTELEAHDYTGVEWTVDKTATEDEDGLKTRGCTVCDYVDSEIITAFGHTHSYIIDTTAGDGGWEWIGDDENGYTSAKLHRVCEHNANHTEVLTAAVEEVITAAKCTEDGSKVYTASVTDTQFTKQKTVVLPKLGHDWDEGVVTTPATIYDKGVLTLTCKRDGCEETSTEDIAKVPSETYSVTVYNSLGLPAAGVTVKLGNYSAVTDDQGEVHILAEKLENDSIYTVGLDGERTEKYGKVTLTAERNEASLYLANLAVSGSTELRAEEIEQGIYAVEITAVRDAIIEGKYTAGERYFKLVPEEAARYTVTLLDYSSTAITSEAAVDNIDEFEQSFTFVLEEGDVSYLSFSTNDTDVDRNYKGYVIFKIEKQDPPAAGVYDRPIRTAEGDNGKIVETADEKVYFRLSYEQFGRYAKVSFEDGIKVYNLGTGKDGEPVEVASGSNVRLPETEGLYNYLYVTAPAGEACTVNLEKISVPGMKEMPIEIDTSATEVEGVITPANNAVTLDMLDKEMWYVLTVQTAGDYTLKTDNSLSVLEIYEDVNSAYIKRSGAGSAVIVTLEEGTPIYIKATNINNESYNFTCAPTTDEDIGTASDSPLGLGVGEYKINLPSEAGGEGVNTYYKFTAISDCTVTFTHTKARTDQIVYTIYNNSDFNDTVGNTAGDGVIKTVMHTNNRQNTKFNETFELGAGESVYIKINLIVALIDESDRLLSAAVSEFRDHDYEITVVTPDNIPVEGGVTVKVMDGEETIGEKEVSLDGVAVFESLPCKEYKLVLTGIPEGYGYYAKDLIIPKNGDEKTEFTLKLTALVDYVVKVELPDGTPVGNIPVKLTNTVFGDLTGETDPTTGAATIKSLPPINANGTAGSFTVAIELSDAIKQTYYQPNTKIISGSSSEAKFTLGEYTTLSLNLINVDNQPLSGVGFTITDKDGNSISADAPSGDDGVVTFQKVNPDAQYSLNAGEGYTIYKIGTIVSSTATIQGSMNGHKITCIYSGQNGLATAAGATAAPMLKSGYNLVNVSSAQKTYVAIKADTEKDTVTYRITCTNVTSSGTGAMNLQYVETGTSSAKYIFEGTNGKLKNGGAEMVNVIEDASNGMVLMTFDVTLNKGDVVRLGLNGTGFMGVEVTEVTQEA